MTPNFQTQMVCICLLLALAVGSGWTSGDMPPLVHNVLGERFVHYNASTWEISPVRLGRVNAIVP